MVRRDIAKGNIHDTGPFDRQSARRATRMGSRNQHQQTTGRSPLRRIRRTLGVTNLRVYPIVALATIASDVEALAEVGTPLAPIYGRHPLALASNGPPSPSSLNGRFTLDIDPSYAMVVEGFFRESYDRPLTHTTEFIDALDPLLSGETCDVEGDEITAKG